MPETDQASKTEEPTSKRLSEAHKKGNFAKSPEIGVTFIMMAALATFAFMGKDLAAQIGHIAVTVFAHLHEFPMTQESAVYWFTTGVFGVTYAIGPVLSACFVAAVIAGGLQSGFRLTPEVLNIKFDKLDPVQGVKRLFSAQSLVQAILDFFKFVAVSFIIWGAVRQLMNDPIFYTPVPVKHVASFLLEAAGIMFIRLIVALAIIAIIHYLFQVHKTKKGLMMSKEEVKDERKNQDMDPKIKVALRRMGLRMLQKQMLDEVPTADVVVTNPTHYAVALRYEKGRDMAPVVLAKGEGHFALRIKRLAKEHEVPMVENKIAARMLFRIGDVGAVIPMETYEMVAKILSHVYRTHRYYFHRLKSRREELANASR